MLRQIADLLLGEMLGAPTRRLILSIAGPSIMEWFAYWEGQPLSIRLTIWGAWITIVYVLSSAAHSQYVNNSAKRRAAFSADLRAFATELSQIQRRGPALGRERHAKLRERIYQRVVQYDEAMAHDFMGVFERQGYPECLQDEIGKLVSFQISTRPRP